MKTQCQTIPRGQQHIPLHVSTASQPAGPSSSHIFLLAFQDPPFFSPKGERGKDPLLSFQVLQTPTRLMVTCAGCGHLTTVLEQLRARQRRHLLVEPLDVGAAPVHGAGNVQSDLGEADVPERGLAEAEERACGRDRFAVDVRDDDLIHDGERRRIEVLVRMLAVAPRERDRGLHVLHEDVTYRDVCHVATPPNGRLQAEPRPGVQYGHVLDGDVGDAAGHLAADRNARARGSDGEHATDDDVRTGLAISHAVLVPPALDGYGVVPHADEAVFYAYIYARICRDVRWS